MSFVVQTSLEIRRPNVAVSLGLRIHGTQNFLCKTVKILDKVRLLITLLRPCSFLFNSKELFKVQPFFSEKNQQL